MPLVQEASLVCEAQARMWALLGCLVQKLVLLERATLVATVVPPQPRPCVLFARW